MRGGCEGPAHGGGPIEYRLVGGVTRSREPREVALDICHEDGDACLGQLTRQQLERLGLAGPRRTRDEPMTIEHRVGDLDADVG